MFNILTLILHMYGMYGMYVQQLTIRQIFPSISFLEIIIIIKIHGRKKKKKKEHPKRKNNLMANKNSIKVYI